MAVEPTSPGGFANPSGFSNEPEMIETDFVLSDRDIEPLGQSNQRTSAILFIVAAVIGVILFAWLQMMGDDDEAVVEEAAPFSPPPLESQRLPEIQTVVEPRPEPVQQFEAETSFDPLAIERLRQLNALELERLRQAQARQAEEEEERLRRRRSDLLVVTSEGLTGSGTPGGFGGQGGFGSQGALLRGSGVNGLPTPEEVLRASQASEAESAFAGGGLGGGLGGGGGFGGGFESGFGSEEPNEVYQNSSSRFLRDAGNSKVKEAIAVNLPDQDTLITQGTFISGVLETAINSDLPGMVRAVVDAPVYSRTGRVQLIPKGSRLVGMYQSGIVTGQTRVFIVWTRLERPDGIVADIASPGTDSLGRAGLGGDVDTHFLKIYGTSAFLSILGPLTALATDSDNVSFAQREILREGGDSFNRSAEIALERNIDIPPTITVDQGSPINIFVAKDLSFKSALSGAR